MCVCAQEGEATGRRLSSFFSGPVEGGEEEEEERLRFFKKKPVG